MTKLEELRAALVKAEAALADAVINAAKVGGNQAAADANVDKARAYCRQIHAALAELKRPELIAWSRERIDAQIKQLEKISKREPTASPSSRQLSEHAVRGKDRRSQDKPRQRKPIHRFNIGLLAQELSPRGALARRALIRQAIGLLALILAYLEYFYMDVQLQIASLPSIFG